MKMLIKKEIRLLLPAWAIAMLLAIVAPWILPVGHAIEWPLGSLIQVLFPLGLLILSVASFGQEFNSGAFSHLLAQPIDRRRIWQTKTTILALAFLIVCFAAFASFLWRFNTVTESTATVDVHFPPAVFWAEFRRNTLEGLLISALVTFSGGLWTTLLLRQITAAFWFTLLIPVAFIMMITAAMQASVLSNESIDTIIIVVLVAYSVAGFFFARHLFLYAQDIQWTGGPIALCSHGRKNIESIAVPVSGRSSHWLFSLFWKEIQLHQANLLIAFILLALNIASVCILKFHPRFNNPNVTFMLQGVGLLWLLMPLITGSAAVADERRIGILDSQLCLPISRRTQLFIKFLVALALSLFLGVAMPTFMNQDLDLGGWIFGIAAATFLISFYASSFARTAVQAIGSAIVICAMTGGLLGLQCPPFRFGLFGYFQISPYGLLMLTLYVGTAILLLVFGILICWNFNWLHENGRLWRRNVASVLVAYVGIFALTNSIYYRAWELILPLQPPAAPARMNRPAQLELPARATTLYVVAPDGRLWTAALGYDDFKYHKYAWAILSREKTRTEFIGGSNWVAVSADNFQAVGIQSDGTLWNIRRKWKSSLQNDRWAQTWGQTGPFTLDKIGSDSDWSQAAGDRLGFLLLKKDGTLWTWGTSAYNWKRPETIFQKFKLDRAALPVPIGKPNTFAKVDSSGDAAFARKNDGTIWRWTGWRDTNYVCTLTLDTNVDDRWADFACHNNDASSLGLSTNGGIFLREEIWSPVRPRYETFHLGQNAKWRVTAFGPFSNVWAIRDDGTLWQWPASWDLVNSPQTKPVQMGGRSDWVALAGDWGRALALAADGSIWAWDQPSRHIWLAPSRKPVYMGNIFEVDDDDNQAIGHITTQ